MSWGKYETITQNLEIQENGIDFTRVLSRELLMILYSKKRNFSYKIVFKSFFLTLDIKEILRILRTQKTLSTIDNKFSRSDYQELVSKAVENVVSCETVNIAELCLKIDFTLLRPGWIFKNFKKFKRVGFSNVEAFFLVSRLSFYERLAKQLNADIVNLETITTKNYLAFNSSFGIETLFTQVFNSTNRIKTFSLSHGISYVKYNLEKPLDYINGFNIVANKVIVWGESSKVDLITNFNYDDSKILIGGNPKYPFKKIDVHSQFNNCVVFLGRKIYDASNIKLLEVISEIKRTHNVEFTLKLHPSLNQDKYAKRINDLDLKLSPSGQSLTELLSAGGYNFAIAYNTTAYYEAMYYSLPCFRYSLNENENYLGLDDKFISYEELSTLINTYKSADNSKLNSDIELILIRTLGMGINNYGQILN